MTIVRKCPEPVKLRQMRPAVVKIPGYTCITTEGNKDKQKREGRIMSLRMKHWSTCTDTACCNKTVKTTMTSASMPTRPTTRGAITSAVG